MPSVPRNYQPVPFAGGPAHVPNYSTLGELLGLKARNSQQGWQQLASVFNQFVQTKRAEKAAEIERADQLAQRSAQEQMRRDEMAARAAERAAAADAQRLQEARMAAQDDRVAAMEAVENTLPGPVDPAAAATMRKFAGTAPLVRSETTLDAKPFSGEMAPPSQYDVRGQTPREVRQAQVDAASRAAAEAAAKDRAEDNARQAARDAEARRHNRVVEARTGQGAQEPLMAVMGDDGNPVYLPRSQAVGKRPASNREQGRPVTSGDAGRLADIDEALKLAGGLDFKPGDTGILPSLGGAMPDAVTNLTGFGLEAKQRQGVINLVKQIIGKGLEGGVLRKEDESKYAKILPTLSDPPEVVQAKIANMQQTMAAKRATLIESLTDAGYDTSKFVERGAPMGGNVTAVPDLKGIREGFSRVYRSGPFAGQEWAMVNGQPKRVK